VKGERSLNPLDRANGRTDASEGDLDEPHGTAITGGGRLLSKVLDDRVARNHW
jgi:hypothetical protein